MTESDWKIFKNIRDGAIELFCQNALAEFKEIIDSAGSTNHDRYLVNYKVVNNKNKEMAMLFDGFSRSKASMQLMLIRKEGLADESLLTQLSDGFRAETDPSKFRW
ncbi:Uncharacterised protein [BD1-7 clade bacterium]|uniref:Uncharacterized protein n=1 Tax=BD1-7 clade bacterium TaxID=2029982 RepID=A0A5S9QJS8_9GAMM|nr:Uncharacterised protein [BD1-7 clade bacterium]CAA0118020.1 Uncharacterised protein [BD1-7 clade bacterium]